MYKLNSIDKIAFILVIIGSLLWGIYGIIGINIIEILFRNSIPFLERTIYILVGLSGIDLLLFLFKTVRID